MDLAFKRKKRKDVDEFDLTSFSLAASSSNEGLPITSRGVSMMGGGGASLA